LLDAVETEAAAIGAVNCVKVDWKGDDHFTLTGYNTDHYGFAQSIKPFLEPVHNKALVLGTGGSSKAVAYALDRIGVDVYFVTRNEKKDDDYFLYEELNAYVLDACKLIVNTTPLGMFPDTGQSPAIPYQYLTPQYLLYDLIYNPEETLFLKEGKHKGAATINGLNMLRLQADKSWEIWQAGDR
jgi:shikimate dehydrogenase